MRTSSLDFIMNVASGVSSVVRILIFSSVFLSAQENCHICGIRRASECQGDFISRLSAEHSRVAQVIAESLACQRQRKQLEKDNNRYSCPMHGTASDKSKLSKIPITLLLVR